MRALLRGLEDFSEGPRRRESDAERAHKAALAAARGEGHAAGYAEGFAAGLAQADAEEQALLKAMQESLRDIELVQTAARQEALSALSPVVEAILRVAAPAAAEAGLADTVAEAVERCLDRKRPERIVARVAPHAVDTLRARFAPDTLVVEPDPALPAGSVRLDWQGGGAVFDATAALAEAEAAIASFFAATEVPAAAHNRDMEGLSNVG